MIPLTPWEGISMNITLTGKVIHMNDMDYWRLNIGDLIAYDIVTLNVVSEVNLESNSYPMLTPLDWKLVRRLYRRFEGEVLKRGIQFTEEQFFEFIRLNLKGSLVKKINNEFVIMEKTLHSYKDAIKHLEELGNLTPSLLDILTIMGKEVTPLEWSNVSKDVENLTPLSFKSQNHQTTPRYGECFEENCGYKLVSASEKRMIFTNGKYYIVDSLFYGHALYIFPSLKTAKEWAENKISAETAMKKAIRRIIHVEGTWGYTLAVALQQLR